MPDDPYREMLTEFEDNCGFDTNASAGQYLLELYKKNVEPVFDNRNSGVLWAGREKKFMMACAAGLGRSTHAVVKGDKDSEVDRKHVEKAAKSLLECWEAVCPLPSQPVAAGDPDESPLRSGCGTMREMLGLPPADAHRMR